MSLFEISGYTEGEKKIISDIGNEMKELISSFPFYIAYSGGMDSTVLAAMAGYFLGKENVKLVHVVFGPYSYSKALENAARNSIKLGLELILVDGRSCQENILKFGPSCNLCTKKVKLGRVLSVVKNPLCLIGTGANKSDSWGSYGLKLLGRTYAPLLDLDKPQIRKLLEIFGFSQEEVKSGESEYREGCKLKHLQKNLAKPFFHGYPAALSNEMLLDYLNWKNIKSKVANVKIIGPLNKNIALVNVKPHLSESAEKEIVSLLSRVDFIESVHIVNRPIILTVIANPSIFRIPDSRKWIEKGKFENEYAIKPEVIWKESKNNKLRTFQVVDFKFK